MLQNYGPVTQACMGTLLTWGLTAAGAAVVVIFNGTQQRLLDSSLGFAAGVMIAASYWSLLDPALEMAEESKSYGEHGEYSFVPVAIGFLLGAFFVYATDILLSSLGVSSPNPALLLAGKSDKNGDILGIHDTHFYQKSRNWNSEDAAEGLSDVISDSYVLSRRKNVAQSNSILSNEWNAKSCKESSSRILEHKEGQWRRILLLVVAVTIHNIPEGLAVGVGFAAIGNSPSATFENARNLAIGIAIQNFPEGIAVSLPLKGAGFSTWRSFWYGQLSGMVELVFGLVGAAGVRLVKPALPYALAFAAGAMVYVVVDDILPEAHASGNGKLASWAAIAGFVVMMILDVGLG